MRCDSIRWGIICAVQACVLDVWVVTVWGCYMWCTGECVRCMGCQNGGVICGVYGYGLEVCGVSE